MDCSVFIVLQMSLRWPKSDGKHYFDYYCYYLYCNDLFPLAFLAQVVVMYLAPALISPLGNNVNTLSPHVFFQILKVV